MKPATESQVRLEMPDGSEVSGLVAVPSDDVRAGLILGHGAGGDFSNALLARVAHAVALRGIAALRYNFPYAEDGRRVPDPKSTLLACCRAAFEWMRLLPQLEEAPIVAGGKSMGGRIASMAVADGMEAAALVFLGYPLHPAGRTDELRVDHLARVHVPMLFVQGDHDRLCDLDILKPQIAKIEAPCMLHVVSDADHSFNVRKRSGRSKDEVYAAIAEVVCRFIEEL